MKKYIVIGSTILGAIVLLIIIIKVIAAGKAKAKTEETQAKEAGQSERTQSRQEGRTKRTESRQKRKQARQLRKSLKKVPRKQRAKVLLAAQRKVNFSTGMLTNERNSIINRDVGSMLAFSMKQIESI